MPQRQHAGDGPAFVQHQQDVAPLPEVAQQGLEPAAGEGGRAEAVDVGGVQRPEVPGIALEDGLEAGFQRPADSPSARAAHPPHQRIGILGKLPDEAAVEVGARDPARARRRRRPKFEHRVEIARERLGGIQQRVRTLRVGRQHAARGAEAHRDQPSAERASETPAGEQDQRQDAGDAARALGREAVDGVAEGVGHGGEPAGVVERRGVGTGLDEGPPQRLLAGRQLAHRDGRPGRRTCRGLRARVTGHGTAASSSGSTSRIARHGPCRRSSRGSSRCRRWIPA
ncbi:hypothetical protein HRbin39_00663 [bacterium HR39]|nr:hypothetical protein HRbin39_00663 [bacterium HR39]